MSDYRIRMGVSRLDARKQASAIATAIHARDADLLAELKTDALAVLRSRSDVAIRFVAESQTDSGCSVAGAYFGDLTPPVLAVAESASPGRRAFTALHEYAHHEQQTNTHLMHALLTQPDGGHTLEEATCDAFAADMLLPDELVSRHIGSSGPSADDVVSLWRASRASRAAVCVRSSERLPAPGQVLILDADGDVQFTAAHGVPPVRRGSNQGHIPVVHQALTGNRWRDRGRTRFAYRDGIVGDEMYAQVANMGGYLIVVCVTDHAPWESFAPTSLDPGPVARFWTCEQCGHEFRSFEPPCRRCGAPTCEDCRRCNCTPHVDERRCEGCFLVLPPRMFSGAASRCVDCSQ